MMCPMIEMCAPVACKGLLRVSVLRSPVSHACRTIRGERVPVARRHLERRGKLSLDDHETMVGTPTHAAHLLGLAGFLHGPIEILEDREQRQRTNPSAAGGDFNREPEEPLELRPVRLERCGFCFEISAALRPPPVQLHTTNVGGHAASLRSASTW